MAASGSKIGALHVSLGLDSASFQAGLKTASVNLNKFGQIAATSFKVVAAGAAIAGAAMGVAVKHAIDYADAIDDAAQKTGVTAEALSRLGYVAKIEGVGLDGLSAGLIKLNKAMAEAATSKTSGAAVAFKALGVSVTDANGRLRSSDAVFADLAGSFARMQDGATKSSLAMQIFGKSGADLIPMLNYGTDGLKRMADESDRFGQTISSKTAAAAGTFNDTLTKIGKILEGVTYQLMEAALPALQSLAQTLASPEIAAAAQTLAANIIGALDKVIQVIAGITNAIADLNKWMDGPGASDSGRSLQQTYPTAYGAAEGSLNKSLEGIGMNGMPNYDYYGSLAGKGGSLNVVKPGSAALFEPIITGAGKAQKSVIDLTENVGKFTDSSQVMAQAVGDSMGGAFSRLAEAVMSGNDALSETVNILMDLGKQLVSSAITGFFGNLFTGGLTAGAGLGAGSIGRGTYGGNGGFFPGFPGFEGGGFTGMGSRTGGVDGRGGFPALLHPNETVIDHTRGGGAGGSLQVTVISEVRNGNLIPTMARVAGEVAGQKVNSMAPLAVSKFQQDRKGG